MAKMERITKIAYDFMLFDCFGIVSSVFSQDNADEIIKYAAINKAYGDTSRHVLSLEGGNGDFRDEGTKYLFNNITPQKSAITVIDGFVENVNLVSFNKCKGKSNNKMKGAVYSGVSKGHIQKWVNMSYKYLCIIYEIRKAMEQKDNPYAEFAYGEGYHMPIDSFVIEESKVAGKWSEIDDYDDFEKKVKESDSFQKHKMPVFEWENMIWIEQAAKKKDSVMSKSKNFLNAIIDSIET